jgi:gliding motility-associated-like protein
MNVKVDSLPIPSFTFTPATCQNTAIHFNNTSIATDGAIESWTWIFGDGSDTTIFAPSNPDIDHLYTQQGIFTASLIVSDSNGCVDSVNHMFQIYPLPVAGFTHSDSACTPGLIYFTDSSYGINTNLSSWSWNFNYPGGYTSNLPNPYHFYTVTDTTYTVMHSVEDAHGCRDTIFDTLFVNKGFTVDFAHESTCYGNPTLFNPMVLHSAADSITSVTWAFGDGENSTLINPEHIFPNDGLFYTQLIATNQFGCESMVIKPIQILQLPQPLFVAEPAGCLDSTYFIDSSIPKSGSITSWHWFFGDGSDTLISAPGSPHIAHLYLLNGLTYQAKLIVTNSNGCSDSLEQAVVRNECLSASFSPITNPCHGQEMYFRDMTQTGSEAVNIVGWWWDFGDGQTAQYDTKRDSVSHTYQITGSYTVALVITAIAGTLTQTDTALYTVNVHETPQADYSTSATCAGKPVQFTDASILEQDNLIGWKWHFAEGDSSFEQHPLYNFNDTLTYDVQMIAFSNYGCTDTIVKNIKINKLQNIHLALPSHHICSDMANVVLRDTSESSNIRYSWDFGDGESISNQSDTISHTYYPGNYEIILSTKAETGCENADTITLQVDALPYANYSFEPDSASVLDAQVRFFDLSEGNGSSINTIQWLFGDGDDTLTANPTHIFSDTGHYKVYQVVTDYNGCSDTIQQTIRIYPELSFFMPSAFTPNQDNKNNIFMPKGSYFQNKTFSMQVFSKWGELIYESSDPYEGWDGTYKGLESPVGVYIWVISLRDMFNDKEVYKGTVMLVR